MGKSHEPSGNQRTCHGPGPAFVGQTAGKAPHQRHQHHAEQRSGTAPAKGCHSKNSNAQHDKIFAQRRVGGFVCCHAVQHFVPSTAMIDFIEIHAVQLADGIWHFALLIKQGIAARYRHQRTGGIPQGQFKHLRIFNRCGQGLPCRSHDGRFGPAERRCIAQFLPVQLIARCIRDAQAAAGGNAGVHPDFHRVLLRGKVNGCRAVRSIHRVLRCFHAAKVGKAHHSNDQRQRCQGFLLFSRPGRLRINAQGAQFQLFLHCFCFIFFDGFHFCQWRNRSMAADGPRGESQ